MAVNTPSKGLLTNLKTFLVGSFELRRVIVATDDVTYRLRGEANFAVVADDELLYSEHGLLESDQDSIEVNRSYSYTLVDRAKATVRFADGSLFHELDLTRGRSRVVHLCGDDVYTGLVVLQGSDLVTRWRCVGPRKHYVATSRLSRTHGAPRRMQ